MITEKEATALYYKNIMDTFTQLFDSPVSDLYNFWGMSLDHNDVIKSAIKRSHDICGLRELSEIIEVKYLVGGSLLSTDLKKVVEKRLGEISNAECFIKSI